MKWVVIALLVLAFFLIATKKDVAQREKRPERVVPNCKPVYLDPPSVYFNEPILYSEWPQAPLEISSSL
jgi:hypothetical protein